MGQPKISITLQRKLKRNMASILTDAELEELAAYVRQMVGPVAVEVISLTEGRFEDYLRWLSLGARCMKAREARNMSIRHAASVLKVPQYRLRAIEVGTFMELDPAIAERYFRFLAIKSFVKRWARMNQGLATRLRIVP